MATASEGEQFTIVYVTSDAADSDTVETELQRADDRFTVDPVTSAAEGRAQITEDPPDCIVSEYQLPELNGLVLLRDIRSVYPDLPFVLFPSDGDEALASQAIDAGVTDYLIQRDNQEQYRRLADRVESIVDDDRETTHLRHRKDLLKRLHDATRDLLDADSPEQVASVASSAADDILDLPLNGVHFYDSGAEGLVPVAVSEGSRELLGDVPVIDTGIAWEVYQQQEPRIYDDIRNAATLYNPASPMRSEMVLPLHEYGVFIFSSPEIDAFDSANIELARTLAANTEAALERISTEQELVEKNQRLDEFVRLIGHDLRNPLQVALGQVDVAQQSPAKANFDLAVDALTRMQALIDDLLQLSRQGDEATQTELVSLPAIAQSSWQMTETNTATLRPSAAVRIHADRNRLKELFENLFRNAIEHGGDDITVTVGEVPGGFYVADTGPGIPESKREKIFEAGYSSTDDGTGFGLRIVHQIVADHGWDITVTESDQGGARFEITGVDIADT